MPCSCVTGSCPENQPRGRASILNGNSWRVRINDFPDEPIYSLMIGSEIIVCLPLKIGIGINCVVLVMHQYDQSSQMEGILDHYRYSSRQISLRLAWTSHGFRRHPAATRSPILRPEDASRPSSLQSSSCQTSSKEIQIFP